MARVFISIGSNIDRETNIRRAVVALREHYGDLARSPIYETSAVGFDGDPFYNLVLAFETDDPPEAVRDRLRRIEAESGRQREGVPRFSARTLDLDMILCGDLIRHDADIDVPAPDIERYPFVLKPLAELAPQARHPERKRTFAELWRTARLAEIPMRRIELDLDSKD
jgi:2-amino-4-hydroxy-6-hydroxymethyldihydropteridine diphosphokinase